MIFGILLLLIINTLADIELSPYACWDQNGTTVVEAANGTNSSLLSEFGYPLGLSITHDDILYIGDGHNCRIVTVHLNSTIKSSITVPSFNLMKYYCGWNNIYDLFFFNRHFKSFNIFATNTSLYVLSHLTFIEKLSLNGSKIAEIPTPKKIDKALYFYFYVDNDEQIYLSLTADHEVIRCFKSSINYTRVAGTGRSGSKDNQLNNPFGLFVSNVGAIYIADSQNHRIMMWVEGASSGIRVAGDGTRGKGVTQLDEPTHVTVDTNQFIYVSEAGNHRITRWAPNSTFGVCIAACTESTGTGPTHLNQPHYLTFDRNGSLYVSDWKNHRVQKFSIVLPLVVVKLIPSTLSYSSPVIFGQHRNIEINSNITFSCNQSSVTTQWTIFICSPTCSNPIPFDPSIKLSEKDLFIGAQLLSSGVYNVELIVTMVDDPLSSASASIYIEIAQSIIIIYFIPLNATTIEQDDGNDLVLNPGDFSIYLNQTTINKSDWFYIYYCRMNLNDTQSWILFDDVHQQCFGRSSVAWKYDNAINSSVTILAGSLTVNEEYEFMVEMIHRHNSSLQSVGYLTVEVKDIQSSIILIDCVINTMCSYKDKFHYINPTTQLSLQSMCVQKCNSIVGIQWNIYQGSMNSSSNDSIQWILYPNISSSSFYGLGTNNLTIGKNFFGENEQIIYWRVEVIYSYALKTAVQTFDIKMNIVPKNGNCSINPVTGTITTIFNITCSNWFDQDGIKDYAIYGRQSTSSSEMMLLAYSTQPIFQLRLPASINPNSTVRLTVQVADTFNAVSEFHFRPVAVLADYSIISTFITTLKETTENLASDPIFLILANGDQNAIGQIVISLSQVFNEMDDEFMEFAVRNGISLANRLVTTLENQIFNHTVNMTNQSILNEFERQLNQHAYVREFLLVFLGNFSINNSMNMIFHSSIIAKLTQIPHQLTTNASRMASNQCQKLSRILKSMSREISLEHVNLTATFLLQCAVNAFNGINGILQGRANLLDIDLNRMKINVDHRSGLSDRIHSYLRLTVDQIDEQMNEIIASVTSSLDIHLNSHQLILIKTKSIEYLLEKFSNSSPIHFPLVLPMNITQTYLLQKIIQPLPFGDQYDPNYAFTNFSRTFSLSILHEHQMNFTNSIEFFISRDPNLVIPPMFLQNVTTLKNEHREFFHYQRIDLIQNNPNLTYSLHLEIQPLDINLTYLLIYQFDDKPQLHSLVNWTYLCPEDLNEDQLWIRFLDNQQISHHHSFVYGIRQLDMSPIDEICSNQSLHPNSFLTDNQPFHFTSDYRLRTYQSGCFYLDKNHQWQSDGLLVGPKTDHTQTQCLSSHLTTSTN